MKTQFLKFSAVRKFVNARGKQITAEFVSAMDTDIRNKLAAATNVHNGGRKKIDASVAGHVGILRSAALVLFCCLALSAPAMDRWNALSQIESGNNDFAMGSAGEVSRFQIKPGVWKLEARGMLISDGQSFREPSSTSVDDAGWIASGIMHKRTDHFRASHGRSPTSFEWYLLWSCPSRVDHPSKFKAEAATRFANLCADGPTVGHGLN